MPASSNSTWSIVSSEARLAGGVALKIKPSPRAKAMRLQVDPRTGEVVLTVPKRVSLKKALGWADEQRGWIERALADVPPAVAIVPGSTIPLYGLPHLIDWDAERSRIVRVEEGRLSLGGPAETVDLRVLRWLKTHARDVLTRETREYAEKAGVSVSRVGIGDPVSRWGSCSESGAIRYSWRLILAPEHVRRATVAHEVAHRVHMNHGRAFHALVRKLYGADPSPARYWLKREGAVLHRIGRR